MMNINFDAIKVEYSEAIDGEIVQVTFDEDKTEHPFKRTKRYICISQNYEFPGKPTIEWHDGKGYDGGAEVLRCNLTNDAFELTTTNRLHFRIRHSCPNDVLVEIQKFLQREFGKA